MEITIEPFIGKSVLDRSDVHFDQYRIRQDGATIGYIGTHDGAKVCLIVRRTPIEQKEIEAEVSKLTGAEVSGTAQVPEVPADFGKKKTESINFDDFDT